jgi:bifunctional enzyme CysN/CysC
VKDISDAASPSAEKEPAVPPTLVPATLRFMTCGSVDDGKSTLIGRLLYERDLIPQDQLERLKLDTRRYGTSGDEIDFALLVDGLEAEREQNITIDVAYRYFATAARSFIVADTPGHEQYTRNMVTAASTSELAVLLVDARKGLLTQTHRHATIASVLGVRHVVLAVNKMDFVDFDQEVFETIVEAFRVFAAQLDFRSIVAIPVSARFGDNVCSRSRRAAWWSGPTLLEHLERVDCADGAATRPMRLTIQWVNRPSSEFRGYAGVVASGQIRLGCEVVVASSGKRTKVRHLLGTSGATERAEAGEAATVVLCDEVDASRGDILCDPAARPQFADQFAAHLVWLSEEPLLPGRSYLMKINYRYVPATVTAIKHRLDVTTLAKAAAKTLAVNELGFCNIAAAASVAFDPYAENHETGAFILVDRFTNATAAAGMISFALRRATNVHLQHLTVTKAAHASIKHQKPAILWFTGLSGVGKSTVANLVEVGLLKRHAHTILLDGDNVRHGLNKDLGFTAADRIENIRRIGEVAKLMLEAGLIVLCSFISPFAAERRLVRELVEDGEFIEIFLDAPLEVCIARDPKGLYKRALAGEIKNFTGVDQPYERPERPELQFQTDARSPSEIADDILRHLVEMKIVVDLSVVR